MRNISKAKVGVRLLAVLAVLTCFGISLPAHTPPPPSPRPTTPSTRSPGPAKTPAVTPSPNATPLPQATPSPQSTPFTVPNAPGPSSVPAVTPGPGLTPPSVSLGTQPAQNANPLTLDEALRLASAQASSFQRAGLNEKIAAEDVKQAQA